MSTKANITLAVLVLWPGLGLAMDAAISGFKPSYPKQEYAFWGARLTMVVVDSLQPTLRWTPFPGRHQFGAGDSGRPFIPETHAARARNVRYDVRIWQVENLTARAVVYERFAIKTNSHTLEESLQPSKPYFWSIRARFEINGETRISEWSLSMIPWTPGESPRSQARRRGQIPAANFYRFETPSAIQARQATIATQTPDKAVGSQVLLGRIVQEEPGGERQEDVTRLTSDALRETFIGNTIHGTYTNEGKQVEFWTYSKNDGKIKGRDTKYGNYQGRWEIREDGCFYRDWGGEKWDGCYYVRHESGNRYSVERPYTVEIGHPELLEGDPKNLDR